MTTAPTTAIHRLAVGRAISVTGWEAGWIALMVAVYARTHSTVWMSAALFFTIATAGLVAPIAGALGDRYDRRLVMITAELATSVFALGMVFTRRAGAAGRTRGPRQSRAGAVHARRRAPACPIW